MHHIHNSAFCKVWFSQNLNGITSATPIDLMHAYCHGVLVYVIKILLVPLNKQEKSVRFNFSGYVLEIKEQQKMNIQGICSQRESQI